MDAGLVEAQLGGHVFKKRVALPGRGKRGGARTLLAYRAGNRAFFVYGYAENERENIDEMELRALKRLATHLLELPSAQLKRAVQAGELLEITKDD
jgi:hypothetical protein